MFLSTLDDICDYFGVKIAMYFAWLGFYTTSMLYPAVIGFVLWMLTESDQVTVQNGKKKPTFFLHILIQLNPQHSSFFQSNLFVESKLNK